jgi:F420-dependent oxidoreductase-like protein
VRFSLWPTLGQPWDEVIATARHADANGWDGVWLADHFMPNGQGPQDGPTLECWTGMAAVGAVTENVRIGALVSGNTYRHPAVLLKQAVTVDHISHGRCVLGLGAGWQENEHDAYGIPYGTFKQRFDKLEEACQVIKGLRDERRSTFQGQTYQLADAPADPKPVGRLPLLIGGTGEQRTLRIVARYADEWNLWGTPDVVAQKSAVLAQRCEEVGRDPQTVGRSAQTAVALVEDPAKGEARRAQGQLAGTAGELAEAFGRYAEAGLDEFIVPTFFLGTELQQQLDRADALMSEVFAALR